MSYVPVSPEDGGQNFTDRQAIKRVLVVDDDPNILRLIPDALEPDFSCTCVSSAERAQEVLQGEDRNFDLIISDVRMGGGMNGIEFVGYVNAHHRQTPIIVMSGANEIAIAVAAFRARAADYLAKPFNLQELGDIVTRVLGNAAAGGEALKEQGWNVAAQAMAVTLCARDDETGGHAVRVVHYSLRLGREMQLSREQMVALNLGSRLHDIGKIGVPDDVLRKPSKLDHGEWQKMRLHPAIGRRLVTNVGLPEAAARVVGQHHEWWNGKGYPEQLSGEEIDITTRIFSVVDAFDAITSDRVYRRGRPYAEALAELRKFSGTQFDPRVVEAFGRIPEQEWTAICLGCAVEGDQLATAANF